MKDNFFLKNTTKVFFVCIGGESMSALAEYFLLKNFTVLGSDVKKTAKTERLQSLGATIFYEQNGKNLSGVDLVVYSSAVDENCVEIQVAKSKNIPCIKRSILLGDILGGFNKSIGVSFLLSPKSWMKICCSLPNLINSYIHWKVSIQCQL